MPEDHDAFADLERLLHEALRLQAILTQRERKTQTRESWWAGFGVGLIVGVVLVFVAIALALWSWYLL